MVSYGEDCYLKRSSTRAIVLETVLRGDDQREHSSGVTYFTSIDCNESD
jgi:hypothetical protein